MATLIELSGARRRFELGACSSLGRDPESAIPVADPMVSRRHAEIRSTLQGRYVLVDLGSRHGTFVGGKRVSERVLSHGDEILLGATCLRFLEDVAPVREPSTASIAETPAYIEETLPVAEAASPSAYEIVDADSLRREYEKLRAALELTRAMDGEPDAEALPERIVDAAFRLLPADRGVVFLADPGNQQLRMCFARTRAGNRDSWTLSSSLIQEVVSQKAGVIATDAANDPRFRDSTSILRGGIRSAMCVPMLYRGELLGILHLDSLQTTNAFARRDLELFASIANHAALAIHNATLRKRIQDVLAEERHRLARVLRDLPDGVLLLDRERRVVLVNPSGEKYLSVLSETKEGEVLERLGPLSLEEVFARGTLAPLDIVVPEPSRRVFIVSVVPPLGVGSVEAETIVVVRDVTQERLREEESARQERLALVGRLAGGIAHDFNNLLTVISVNANWVLELANDPDSREGLEEIRQAGRKATALTRQLLAFSRREAVKPEALDLNLVVTDMEKLLRRTIGADIEFQTALAPDLWPVTADAAQMERVLMNLVVNSRDAMPQGGTLIVETANRQVDEASSRNAVDLRPGRYVTMSIKDTGTGMTPAVLGRVFEPFFTTKDQGQGTGLGLATVYGIVQQAGGTVRIDSQLGAGTTAIVYLPATESDAAQPSRPSPEAVPGGDETILLVEDEEAVRGLASRILREAGYQVLPARDGEEALRVTEGHQKVDLVVTDVITPRVSAKDLVERLCATRAGLKVLYISGYPEAVLAQRGLLKEGIGLLEKPFTQHELLGAVHRALRGN